MNTPTTSTEPKTIPTLKSPLKDIKAEHIRDFPRDRTCKPQQDDSTEESRENSRSETSSSGDMDTDLLERFVVKSDPEAFAELVQRHSMLVLGVCRRVLRDGHEIDDVFQATFLTLVRDVSRVRKREALASWLYGVAYRLAMRVARQKVRRRETTLMDENTLGHDALAQMADRHERQLVDDELNALPDRYRKALVLRYLAGKPPRDVAEELGITIGTLEGLLRRGKDELRARLLRRGVTMGAVVAVLEATQTMTQAAETSALIQSTIQVGQTWLTTSPSLLDPISDRVFDLSGKELTTMTTLAKAGWVAGITAGVLTLGAVGLNVWREKDNGHATAGITTTMNDRSILAVKAPLITFATEPVAAEEAKATPATTESAATGLPETNAVNRSAEKEIGVATETTPIAKGDVKTKWDFKARLPMIVYLESALKQEMDCSFSDTPLKDVIVYLKELHHVEIKIDEKALADNGFSNDHPITIDAAGITLKSTLRLILDPHDLDYTIENEVLKITTRSVADSKLETRVYNVARVKHLATSELLEIITATIHPETWAESGGNGDLRAAPNTMVVRQTHRVHDDIVDLLDQLEAQAQENPPTDQAPKPGEKSRVVRPPSQAMPLPGP